MLESDPQIRLNNEECYKSIRIVYQKYKRKCVPCKNRGRDPKLPRITEEEEAVEKMADEEVKDSGCREGGGLIGPEIS